MKHFLLAVACSLLLAGSVLSAPFDHGPYAGAPNAEGITISWSGDPQLFGRVEYGPKTLFEEYGLIEGIVKVPPHNLELDVPVHVVITGLKPATEYIYRVVLADVDTVQTSSLGRFKTEPADGEPISFAVLADTQWQWEGENRLEMVGDAIAPDARRSAFDFVLHAGDIVESPLKRYWDHWFASFDEMLLSAPFIPVLGNHEKNHRSYYYNFAHPPGAGKEDERWWALHWGDVVIVGLDTNARRVDQILTQQAWARNHLSGVEPHKFVIFHHPIFSSDACHGSGYGYEKIYHPIFVETGVDIVFNGHAHNYERIVRDGVTYLVLGGGGATPRPLAEERVEGSVVAVEDHLFYARVTTSGNTIDVDVISVACVEDEAVVRTPNEILDSFSMPSGIVGLSLKLDVRIAGIAELAGHGEE